MGDRMQKFSRNQRIAAVTKILLENPNKIMGLNNFTEMFNTAKSTVSEDIVVVKDTLNKLDMGKINTVSEQQGELNMYVVCLMKRKGNLLKNYVLF